MPIPEKDLRRIETWCRERVPESHLDQLRVEADEAPRHVTIVEVRPPWDGEDEWTRFVVARLRFTATTGLWTLYWVDRNERFHQYPRRSSSKNVQTLLNVLERDEDAIFWG